jgi:hypothetical protein
LYRDKIKQFQSHPSKAKQNNNQEEFFSKDVLKVMRIFGQFEQPFDELEKLADENDEYIRANTISNIFLNCLNSYRPIKSMKEIVEMYRSTKCMNKIAYYFFKSE